MPRFIQMNPRDTFYRRDLSLSLCFVTFFPLTWDGRRIPFCISPWPKLAGIRRRRAAEQRNAREARRSGPYIFSPGWLGHGLACLHA